MVQANAVWLEKLRRKAAAKTRGTCLEYCELVIDDQREQRDGQEQELDAKRVVIAIIRGLKLDVHQVERCTGCANEDNLRAAEGRRRASLVHVNVYIAVIPS